MGNMDITIAYHPSPSAYMHTKYLPTSLSPYCSLLVSNVIVIVIDSTISNY